jgi:predicted dehydrogenase
MTGLFTTGRNAGVIVLDERQSRVNRVRADYSYVYTAHNLAALVRMRPAMAVVATPDDQHLEIGAMLAAAGIPSLIEKPVAQETSGIPDLIAHTVQGGAVVRVGHNLRFHPVLSEIQRLVGTGALGSLIGVDFRATLDRAHGESYFRRWHRRTAASGGLQVTKSCHHLDLINWWMSDLPQSAAAMTARRGDPAFYPADADIDDSISADFTYRSGAHATYRFDAFGDRDGFAIRLSGTSGKLEAEVSFKPVDAFQRAAGTIKMTTDSTVLTWAADTTFAGHGGADARMLGSIEQDGLAGSCLPDVAEAAWAVAMGEAIGVSSRSGGQSVDLQQSFDRLRVES